MYHSSVNASWIRPSPPPYGRSKVAVLNSQFRQLQKSAQRDGTVPQTCLATKTWQQQRKSAVAAQPAGQRKPAVAAALLTPAVRLRRGGESKGLGHA